jgi:heme exporter protein CcmD
MLHFGGRHAAFVWAAYGVTAPVLAALVAQSLLKARRWRRAADAIEAPSRTPEDRR